MPSIGGIPVGVQIMNTKEDAMKDLKKMLAEMDDAQRHADEMKEKIAGALIEGGHLDLVSVNWRKLRMWLRRI